MFYFNAMKRKIHEWLADDSNKLTIIYMLMPFVLMLGIFISILKLILEIPEFIKGFFDKNS